MSVASTSQLTKRVDNDEGDPDGRALASAYIQMQREKFPDMGDIDDFWELFASEVTPEIMQRMEMERDVQDRWINGPFAEWELKQPSFAINRRLLFEAWRQQSGDLDVWNAIRQLWELAHFDAITQKEVVLHSIVVTLDHNLQQKDEIDIGTPESSIGRLTLTHSQCRSLSWGIKNDQAHAVRGKINGIRFVRISSAILRGPWDVVLPEDFPAQLVEYYAGKYYVLYPYAFSDAEVESGKGRCVFRGHPWLHPRDFEDSHKFDGIMILTSYGEYRVKKVPTCEIQRNGVPWEVALTKSGPHYIRPRPGKKSYFSPIGLSMEVTMDQVLQKFPRNSEFSVREHDTDEEYKDMFIRDSRKQRITIDGGIRWDDDKGKYVQSSLPPGQYFNEVKLPEEKSKNIDRGKQEKVKYKKGQNGHKKDELGQTSSSQQVEIPVNYYHYVGSKLVVYHRTLKKLMMYHEEGKLVDFVGGNREKGETPRENLVRELKEETQCQVSDSRIVYLGESSIKEQKTSSVLLVNTSVFMLLVDDSDELVRHLTPYDVSSVVASSTVFQPWVERISNFVHSQLGNIHNIQFIDRTEKVQSKDILGEWLVQFLLIGSEQQIPPATLVCTRNAKKPIGKIQRKGQYQHKSRRGKNKQ